MGFIGTTFKDKEDKDLCKYSIPKLLHNTALSDQIIISPSGYPISYKELPKDLTSLIIFGYSDERSKNFELLNDIFSLAHALSATKIIYIGTTAKYQIEDGLTNEDSPDLKLKDFYAETKIDILKFLKSSSTKFSGSIIVLHPTIVLGEGGNWNRVIIDNLKIGNIILPKGRSGFCNPVHVDDICLAVKQALITKPISKYREYIISSGIIIEWRNIYETARKGLLKKGIECGSILEANDKNLFSSKAIHNAMYHIIYSRLGFFILLIYKKLRSLKKSIAQPKVEVLYNPRNFYEPRGIYRLMHSSRQIFSSDRAKSELSYKASFDEVDKIKEYLIDKAT